MAAKTFATYLSELTEATALGTGDRVPVLESSTVKYVDGAELTPYLKYVALLSQSGTDAPTATVLENTLGGTVVWTREGGGEYVGTLSGAFTENKTWFAYPNTSIDVQSQGLQWLSVNSVGLNYDTDYEAISYIEIRVYP